MELATVVKGYRAYIDSVPGVFELVIVVSALPLLHTLSSTSCRSLVS